MPVMQFTVSDNFEAVTPADSNLDSPTRAIYVGTGGALNVTPACEGGAPTVLQGVPSGATLYLSVNRVSASDTDASNVVVFY